MLTTKRLLLTGGTAGLAVAFGTSFWPDTPHASETFAVTHSDADWQKLLTPTQPTILRQSGTERPFISPLLHEERRGKLACAGCDLELFSPLPRNSTAAPDGRVSGRRWITPSALVSRLHVRNDPDWRRTAIGCGGHLGHEPSTTDQSRQACAYCMNGAALTFKPKTA